MKRHSPACGAFQESVSDARSRYAETSITSFVCTKPSFTGTASNLLVVSLKKANAYYDALISRGYDGELRFLEREKKMAREQTVLAVAYFLCIAVLFAMKKANPFG